MRGEAVYAQTVLSMLEPIPTDEIPTGVTTTPVQADHVAGGHVSRI